MADYRYVPLESSIARIYELISAERVSEKVLYKWATDAIKEVYTSDTMEDKICFAKVTNYKAKLPSDWKKLKQILYNEDAVDTNKPIEIYLTTTNLIDGTVAETNKAFNTNLREETEKDDQDTVTTDIYQSRQPLLGQPQGTAIQGHNYEFEVDRPLQRFEHYWRPLRKSTSFFHKTINCGSDLTAECEKHTYSYDKGCDALTVSFETGWVCIAYSAYPRCHAGFLIPDRESKVPQAIEKYLLYKIFEKEEIKGVQGSARLSQKYHREWEIMCAAAKGEQKLPGVDDMENLKNMLVRLTQHNNAYRSGFGNMSDFENLILT